MTTLELTQESMRADLARKILNADPDVLKKVSDYLSCLLESKDEYFESEEFYKDIEKEELEIQKGNYLSISNKSDLDKLFAQ